MIDVRLAASSANDYLKGLYPEATNVKLEEIELTDDEKFWYITLSYDTDKRDVLGSFNIPRSYKVFKLDANNGNVLSMKIREMR